MYSKIHDTFWQSTKRKGLSQKAKLMFAYFFSCSHRNIIGLYYIPFQYISSDLGIPLKEVSETVSELLRNGLIAYDEQSEMVLVRNFLEHNPLPNANTEKSAVKVFAELPNTLLFQDFLTVLKPFAKQYRNLYETVYQTVSNTETEAETEAEAITEEAPQPSAADVERFFESAWKLYPEKKGKGQISDASKKRLYAIGFDEISRCIDRYKKSKPAEMAERKHVFQFWVCGLLGQELRAAKRNRKGAAKNGRSTRP